MTVSADPCWAAAAGLSPAARAALALPPPTAPGPLAALLTADLPPADVPEVTAELPPRELHAVAAACGPDLCLIDCPPGTDRPGFAVAVAVEAGRRGERVAILTASAADADLVLSRLLDADLTVGRACGPDEPPDPDHGFAAHADEAAALARRLAEHRDRRRADHVALKEAITTLPRLAELAEELTRLAHEPGGKPAAPPPPKTGGLLGTVRGWFGKPAAEPVAPPPADDRLQRQAETLERFRAAGRAVAVAGLPVPTPAGLAATAEAVRVAEAAAVEALAQADTQVVVFAADRPRLERGLCRGVPVVVGPAAALADPLLVAADRVVVLAADTLDDATLAAVAGVAPARVLLGAADPHRPHRNGKSGTYHRPTLFRRLWDRLAAPEVWALDGVQLVATLRSHDPADTRDEPLADRRDVELRFTRAGDLAAVAFPPTVPLVEAKALLAGELGFVALAPCGPAVWHDAPERLAVCWPAADSGDGDWADLGDGVRELVCGSGPDGLTASVGFDRAKGWTRERADAWLAERRPTCRAVRLPAPVLVAG